MATKKSTQTLRALLGAVLVSTLALSSPAGAAPKGAQTASAHEVQMVGTNHNQYEVVGLLNDVLPIRAVIDTGASLFYLPHDVALALVKTGTLMTHDRIADVSYTVVGGQSFTARRFLVTLTLGAYRLANVEAAIGTTGGNILIGSEVLQRFQSFGIDHTRRVLRLGSPR